ncbi:MAG: T9SS-dependent M36 family metallopeptidase [Leeuwenhoekiella sp.]
MKKLIALIFLLTFCFSQAQNYNSLIDSYLNSNKGRIETKLIDYHVMDQSSSDDNGITHVYLQQLQDNLPIINVNTILTIKDNKIIYGSNNFLNTSESSISKEIAISPEKALRLASEKLGLRRPSEIKILNAFSDTRFLISSTNISSSDIPMNLAYYKTKTNELRMVWNFSIETLDKKHWWSICLDAESGDIQFINDWMLSCTLPNHRDHTHGVISKQLSDKSRLAERNRTFAFNDASYRVYPLPLMSPNEGGRELLTSPHNEVASPFGWHDTNGQEGADTNLSMGNNVTALDNRQGGDNGDLANGKSAREFDFKIDFENIPESSVDAAITNIFYVVNTTHDILALNGFNEESGNFQKFNYTRKGLGGDEVNAFVQDGSGFDNATFGTLPEGSSPTMRMFLWTATGGPGDVLKIQSGSLQGDYQGIPSAIGKVLTSRPVEGNLVLVKDNNSSVSSNDENDGCDTFLNSSDLSKNIAVMTIGQCDVEEKILKAQRAGARGAVIINNSDNLRTLTGINSSITIPSVLIKRSDGIKIIEGLSAAQNPTAQVANNGPFQRDGAFDNGIIIHEYAHGISNRLTGGPSNVNCLRVCTERNSEGVCIAETATEQMGEGWSDYYAVLLTLKESDLNDNGKTIGNFVRGQDSSGGGLRPAPYSRSFAINDYTYKDTNDPSLSFPHGVGFVWASMLWDMTLDLIDVYGFDPNVYTGTGGNNIALKLVTEGLKIQPCQPGFVDGRDAILAADLALFGGKNQCIIYKAFARRGLGLGASQGEATSRSDQMEAFNVPDEFKGGNCNLSISTPNPLSFFKVFPNPTKGKIEIIISSPLSSGQLKVHDVHGRQIKHLSLSNSSTIDLDLGSFSSGIYFVSISSEQMDQPSTVKVILN